MCVVKFPFWKAVPSDSPHQPSPPCLSFISPATGLLILPFSLMFLHKIAIPTFQVKWSISPYLLCFSMNADMSSKHFSTQNFRGKRLTTRIVPQEETYLPLLLYGCECGHNWAEIRQQVIRGQSINGITCHCPLFRGLDVFQGRTGLSRRPAIAVLCVLSNHLLIQRWARALACGLHFRFKAGLSHRDLKEVEEKLDKLLRD